MLKKYKNYPINLEVTREGELDTDYYAALKRIERRQTAFQVGLGIVSGLAGIAAQIAQKMAGGLQHVVFLIHLDIYDAAHGTHLRAEYFAEKQRAQMSELRGQFSAW